MTFSESPESASEVDQAQTTEPDEVVGSPPDWPRTSELEREPVPLANPNWPQRVLNLEQALDQCQAYIEELKQQLVQQQFLEDILARTEETAQIQQQAILSLKQQLAVQQQTQAEVTQLQAELAASQTNLHQISQSYQAQALALTETTSLLQQRQDEILTLQNQLRPQRDQIQLLHYRTHQLEAQIQERQQQITDLEARLHRSAQVVTAQQDIISALQQAQGSDSNKNQVIQSLSQNLLAAQNKIQGLETEYANQRLQQAKLQHHAQEVEEHAIQQQVRINKLEQQVAEMQEQILHQAQQAREQETAIQHWKDRHYQAEKTILQLKAVLSNLLKDRHFLELMNLDADALTGTWGPGDDLLKVLRLLGYPEAEGNGQPLYLSTSESSSGRSEETREISTLGAWPRGH